MVGCVVADDVDHRRVGAPGVVHVGEPVGESGPEVQQGGSRPVRHAPIAVGRARDDALEQPEHAPHIPDPTERRDEVHLRGARVGEADLHSRAGQRLDQAFRPVHPFIAYAPVNKRTPPILGSTKPSCRWVWAATAEISNASVLPVRTVLQAASRIAPTVQVLLLSCAPLWPGRVAHRALGSACRTKSR